MSKPRMCKKCEEPAGGTSDSLLCRRHYNEYQAQYRESHKERRREIARRSQRKNYNGQGRIRILAICSVYRAVKSGKLKRSPCEECGGKKTFAHHDSYDKEQWLNIRWLCKEHHELWHRNWIPTYTKNGKPESVNCEEGLTPFNYICRDCDFVFSSKTKILDVICPSCENIHIRKIEMRC